MAEVSVAIPELGKLVAVELRAAWGHEATSFTPWLAEHLDNLADLIGIPLELEGVEVSVGTFYADILARNPNNDSRVLIENQLEKTDHRPRLIQLNGRNSCLSSM